MIPAPSSTSKYLLFQDLANRGFDLIRISKAIDILLGTDEYEATPEDDEERSAWLAEYDRRMDALERDALERHYNANTIRPL